MPDLQVATRRAAEVVVVEPQGFINAHTVAEFEGVLNALVEAGDVRIVISGAHLSYVASAGFGAIMGLIEEAPRGRRGHPGRGAHRDRRPHLPGPRFRPAVPHLRDRGGSGSQLWRALTLG